MSKELFIWDRKGRKPMHISLDEDFEVTKNSTRETLIYGALAIEEICYWIYKKHLTSVSKVTESKLTKFRNTSFAEKINILEILVLIDFSVANKLRKIKDTRNAAAHYLDFDEILYQGKTMPLGLTQFKKDCFYLWDELNKKLQQ